jgi:TolB-like protein
VRKIKLRRSVAVLGFKNLSGRQDEGWLSTALSEMLTTELSAGEHLRTVPGESLAQMKVSLGLQDADGYGKDTLSRIQRVVDADDVLVGSYLALRKETGGKVHLDLKLQDVGAGETTAAIVEDGTEDQLPELVSRAGVALLENVQLQGEIAFNKGDLSTARRLYQEALNECHKSGDLNAEAQVAYALADLALEPGNIAEAEQFARRSVTELDKEKAAVAALAHATLARVQLAQGKSGGAQSEIALCQSNQPHNSRSDRLDTCADRFRPGASPERLAQQCYPAP